MTSKGRHPKPATAAALTSAKKEGMAVLHDQNGHRWGWVVCNCGEKLTISCSPRPPEKDAKRTTEFIRKHKHH
ncbi:hypothetical protein AB0O31_16170 [Kitasatospora cineracea]|uniref:hypothetical protein n=1 Tax=Kitasatospora cineracea TaxID=88074 RepID=UPI0034495A05